MIRAAKKMLKRWHLHLGEAFGRHFYRHVAHQLLHLPDQALLHGSPLVHSCFFGFLKHHDFTTPITRKFTGESCVGKIASLVTCPSVALKQMKDRLISVHGEYSELTDNEMQMYSTKGRKPADANMYIYANFDQFGDAISTYIRFL